MRPDRGSPGLLTGLLVGALAVVFFAPGIFGGEVPIFRDLLILAIPLRSFAKSAISAGTLPLWTDDLFWGAPFLANYQSAVFYPPSLLVYALPFALGFSLFLALHLAIAGWGMTRYLGRRCHLEPPQALLGGVVFAFGGFVTSLVPLTNQLEVAAWLPWTLLAGEELVASGRWRRFFQLTILVSLQALGGAPEALLLTLLLLAATSAVEAARGARWTRLLGLCMAVALALLLCAAQLLPTAEYAAATDRSAGLDLETVTAESLTLRSLVQFLLPHVFYAGGPGFVPEGGVPLFWSLYVGIVPLALALPNLFRLSSGLWPTAFWASLLLSLGSSTALFAILHGLAPRIVGAFRFPGKFFLVAHFALALIAARALAQTVSEPRARRAAIAVFSGVALLGVALAAVASVSPAASLRITGYDLPPELGAAARRLLASGVALIALRSAALAFIAAGLLWQFERRRLSSWSLTLALVALTVFDLVSVHRPTVPFTPWQSLVDSVSPEGRGLRQGERIFHYRAVGRGLAPWSGGLLPGENVEERARSLWSALIPDVPMVYGLGAASGSDGFATRDQRTVFQVLAELPRERGIHLLSALGIRSLIGTDPLLPPAGTSFTPSAPPWQYDLPDAAPRTYLAERVLQAADVASALERLAAADFRAGRDAVVVAPATAAPEELRGGRVQALTNRAGALSADLVLPDSGLWVVSDTWFPGWRATIDGAPTEILRVNGVVRGVRVPAGAHRVEMRYEPQSFRLGCRISAAAAFLLLAAAIYAVVHRRRRH